ncbi:hypothetical protein CAOG_05973 [Capsaspora owczarzaki ATCC 30864]|uniref:hypothetical protein n=1 Tax=Capsaspora owczarzaki (strain ATCC 30864) TaxID=595528 RepID=UPI000352377B|nr:hypothetical protein CAOG_05973 [Capsaspora owczarzaki ATCC 30864]|eukprot:XP_004345563.2 hypothetical protein CAOG_05973 [Capsaspora owczarzaki ATCC 30864]
MRAAKRGPLQSRPLVTAALLSSLVVVLCWCADAQPDAALMTDAHLRSSSGAAATPTTAARSQQDPSSSSSSSSSSSRSSNTQSSIASSVVPPLVSILAPSTTSPSEEEFNEAVRHYVIAGLVFAFLYAMALLTIRAFLRPATIGGSAPPTPAATSASGLAPFPTSSTSHGSSSMADLPLPAQPDRPAPVHARRGWLRSFPVRARGSITHNVNMLKPQSLSYSPEDDAVAEKVSIWLCTFTLAVSLAAILLLPISIVSNEVLLRYPDGAYIQWLNGRLIYFFWDFIFLSSNAALFVLLPFAYFFMEAVGLFGRGLLARVYETSFLVGLLSLLFIVFAYVIQATFTTQPLANFLHYFFFLYSGVSLLGAVVSLWYTPLGVAQFVARASHISLPQPEAPKTIDSKLISSADRLQEIAWEETRLRLELTRHQSVMAPAVERDQVLSSLAALDREKHLIHQHAKLGQSSHWLRRVFRSISSVCTSLAVLALSGYFMLQMAWNVLTSILKPGTWPLEYATEFAFGVASSSSILGTVGAVLDIVLMGYFLGCSILGILSSPWFRRIRPQRHNTSIELIILNCAGFLLLSSSLPLLSRILGVTNFDLLGRYAQFDWLKSRLLLVFYNIMFLSWTAHGMYATLTRAM